MLCSSIISADTLFGTSKLNRSTDSAQAGWLAALVAPQCKDARQQFMECSQAGAVSQSVE